MTGHPPFSPWDLGWQWLAGVTDKGRRV